MPAKGSKCCCGPTPPDPWPPGIVVVCAVENITVPSSMSVVIPGNDKPGSCCVHYPGDYTLNRIGTSSTGTGCTTAYESTERTLTLFACDPGAIYRVGASLTYDESTGDVQCRIAVYGPSTAPWDDWSSPTVWQTTIAGNGPNLVRDYSCPHFSGVANCYNSIPATLDATPS